MMPSKKTIQWIIIALAVIIVLGVVIYKMKTKSTYVYPETNITYATPYAQLDAEIQKCNDANTANPNATTLNDCTSSAMNRYISNVCPAVLSTVTSSGTCTDTSHPNRQCNLQNWVTAKTKLDADIATINNYYSDMKSRTGQTFNNGSTSLTMPSTTVLDEARKADMRGATRRYLSTVCSGTSNVNNLYSSNTFNTGLSVYREEDPTYIYQQWSNNSTSGNYGIADSRIDSGAPNLQPINSQLTGAQGSAQNNTIVTSIGNIIRWASNAYDFSSSTVNEVSYTGTPGNLVAGNQTNTYSNNIPRWAIAANFGPATVIKSPVPITWKDSATGTVKTHLFTPPSSGVLF